MQALIARRTFLIAGLGGIALGTLPGLAQGDAIQSQDTNVTGIVADITQVKRKDGVLTLRVRLRNTGQGQAYVPFQGGSSDFDKYYLTAADKKYFILRDTEKTPLASPDGGARLDQGASFAWWAKFPAPPPDMKAVTFYAPYAPPFEDLPITD